MKRVLKILAIAAAVLSFAACKKSSGSSSNTSAMAGFWTYKTDVNNPDNYWNGNVLFLSNGTFRMYTALSFDDTAAAKAIADTSDQVVTFGTFTISGSEVKMVFSEFTTINIVCTGSVNPAYTKFDGTLEVASDPNSAKPLWVLTKP